MPAFRSAKPEREERQSIDDSKQLRMVPTSFSGYRQPVLRIPEPIPERHQEASSGRALQDSNFLSSAIARSFQDVLPSDINSLSSSTTDDIQKSPLANEYSYGNSGYYEYPQAQERYHPQHPYQAGYPADYFQSPPTGTVSDIGDTPSPNSISGQKNPADTYQPAPYSPPPGYPSYNPYPYSYNPPAPPPPPEEPPEEEEDDDEDLDKGVYTHYNIGRKLYYAPLWFSLYMTGYLFVEICKHVWRHKYTYPVRAEDALGIGRSAGDNATDIEHVTQVVTKAIETNTKKYNKSE